MVMQVLVCDRYINVAGEKNDPFMESLQEDNVLDERLFILPCKSNLNSRSRHELY